MFHYHTLRSALPGLCVALGYLGFLQGCTREQLPDMDNALKLVLLDKVSNRTPPEGPHESIHCIAFLDTARKPPPRMHAERLQEWNRLCESERQGRVKDPEPWVIPSLRKEFLLDTPDLRPFSQCSASSLMTRDEWERTRLVLVERMDQTAPDTIRITLHIRSPCQWEEQGEDVWGNALDCYVRRDKDGQWKFETCKELVIII